MVYLQGGVITKHFCRFFLFSAVPNVYNDFYM